MRCDDLRERLDEMWTGETAAELREHLARCPECASYAREVGRVRAGFLALASEPVPEPSLGFAQRLVRGLGEASERVTQGEFFERAGKRFVYATLLMTLLLLLALVLPPSGPVRGMTTADLLMAGSDTAALRSDPIGAGSWQELQEVTPPPTPVPDKGGER